ncbi:MAG: hypothetical protein Q9186_000831 [Xanthomendoza sp. 1 TL-2023]
MTDPNGLHVERFGSRSSKPEDHHHGQSFGKEPAPSLRLNTAIREYVKDTASSARGPPFVHIPEIPTSEEICVPADDEEEEVPVNHVVGPWASKQKYLADHYALLREDSVAPLRNVVSELQAVPEVLEKDSVEKSQIYEKVNDRAQAFIVGLTFAHGGVAAKVTFSLRRTGKKIIWEQSKRLQQGTLVALTPAHDMFKSVFEREVHPPYYVVQQPFKDLSSVLPASSGKYDHVNILDNQWSEKATSDLDASQMDALHRILSKELAVIQGPPGTGKTHVSVVALKVLLENKRVEDPPIIVAAQTNHALDQLLRHIASVEPKFIRLGGMTLDQEIIKQRTLFEVKQSTKLGIVPGGLKGPALAGMRSLIHEMQTLLKPLTEGKPFGEEVFKAHKILTEEQCKYLLKGAEKWVDTTLPDSVTAAIHKWAGEELIEANHRTNPEDYGFEYEEMDLEYEQLKELEAEGKVGDGDDDNDALRGERVVFSEPWTGRGQTGRSKVDYELLLKESDLWTIAPESRGPLYRHMQQRIKETMRGKMRQLVREYDKRAIDLKIGKWEVDTNFLKESNIIGCTTTGLSKYRGLLHSLQPKIVLIEEAAEVLEAQVAAACFDSLEHLILVGDHQQLRGRCNERELEGKPWFLDVSMFERLVRNHVGFTQLIRQRRMHPEIRRGLIPIYPNLEDHPSVELRAPVPGMGPMNTYFFSHAWPEDADNLMSKVNRTEAVMVVGLFNYLINNGMKTKDITVLTFYNGQRKLILSELRKHPNMQGEAFRVVTVDSYQGEENGVILLSLVRSNWMNQIGFLSIANRVCVALSRAQRGFYVFGDARLLSKQSHLWFKIVKVMSEKPRRIGFFLPLTCVNHGVTTYVKRTLKSSLSTRTRMFSATNPAIGSSSAATSARKSATSHADVLVVELDQVNRDSRPPMCHFQIFRIAPRPIAQRIEDDLTPRDSATKTPSVSPSKTPYRYSGPHSQALMELTPEGQPFRDFAAGGYVEADAAAIVTTAEIADKERLRQLDEVNEAALFGDLIDTSLTPRTNELKLTATRQTRDGTTRNIYEGLYSSSGGKSDVSLQEPSLLD